MKKLNSDTISSFINSLVQLKRILDNRIQQINVIKYNTSTPRVFDVYTRTTKGEKKNLEKMSPLEFSFAKEPNRELIVGIISHHETINVSFVNLLQSAQNPFNVSSSYIRAYMCMLVKRTREFFNEKFIAPVPGIK